MKALYVAVAILLVVSVPFFAGNQSHGQLIFSKSPDINLNVSGKNISVELSHPIYSGFNLTNISKLPNQLNQSKNRTEGVMDFCHYTSKKNGTLSFIYTYQTRESIFSIPSTISYSSYQKFPLKPYAYLYVNMTISINKMIGNITLPTSQGYIIAAGNNSLEINYSIQSHITKKMNFSLVVPTFFKSNHLFPVSNFTNEREFHKTQRMYNGLRVGLLKDSYISLEFNRTFIENGQTKLLVDRMMGGSQSFNGAVFLYFPISGQYSNITYDPYLTLPIKNIETNLTVAYLPQEIENIMINNSIFLGAGIAAGVAIISTSYIFYRRSK